MDENLNIRVTIAGQKELNDLIKKVNEGNASLEDLRKIQRAFRSEREKNIIGSQSEIRLAEEEVKVKERISAATDKLLTKKGRERDEYFRTGLQLRQGLLPLMGDLTNSLNGADFSFKSLTGSVASITSAFGMMTAKGHSVGQILSGLGKSLMGPAGLALGIPLVIGLAMAFTDKFSPAVKAAWNELKKLNEQVFDLQFQLGKITKEQYMEKLLANLESLVQKRSKLLSGGIIKFDLFAPGFFVVDVNKLKDQAEAEKEILDTEKKIADQKKKTADDEKKALDDLKKKEQERFDLHVKDFELSEKRWKVEREGIEFNQKMSLAADIKALKALPNTGMGPVAVQPGKMGEKLRGDIGLTFSEMVGKTRAFEYAFASASGNIAQGISSKIGGAFARVFGGANSMLGQFAANFASTLTDILLQLGIRTGLAALGLPILPFAGGGVISEPVLGRGLQSGRMYSFAERGPERVIPNGNQIGQSSRFGGSGGNMIQPSVTVVPLESNYGLAVRVEIGNKQKSAFRVGA